MALAAGTRPVLGAFLALAALSAAAQVTVVTGPTHIPRGDARSEKDITVSNGLFAVAFAVGSAPPWGVARGGIIDIALLDDDRPGYDIASLADFMPNDWSSWPTTYQAVGVSQTGSDEVVVTTRRDWGEVQLETTFTIRDNDSVIDMDTRMVNSGTKALHDIRSGYVVWPDGGYVFGVPGLPGILEGSESVATADWSAMYDEDWVIGLHTPFASHLNNNGRDRYLRHSLEPGESRRFSARLQIEADGDLAPLVAQEIAVTGKSYGTVTGSVTTSDGRRVSSPAIVAEYEERPYAWSIGSNGRFRYRLPVGDYVLYATAEGHSRSTPVSISVRPGVELRHDFDDLEPPGVVEFYVAERDPSVEIDADGRNLRKALRPTDARISIDAGDTPLIRYHGQSVYFTELDAVGYAAISIAPGQYTFGVSAGGGFTAQPEVIELVVSPGGNHRVSEAVVPEVDPRNRNWYSVDLHHHSDVLDGFTPPEYVLRSELAAGLDVAFLSDHDSVVNNAGMRQLAARRNTQFIAATELSPSWAHFNAWPLDDGKTVDIDTGQASVQEIFAEARRMGAELISANHPSNNYGYFTSLEKPGAVPGGYDARFDLIEIVSATDPAENEASARRAWMYWNEGHRKYLVGGSDTHDVWSEHSGSTLTLVYVEGELTVDKLIESVRTGRAYASQGPVIFPQAMFGESVFADKNGSVSLVFDVHAVNGIDSVRLIERGREIDSLDLAGEVTGTTVDFSRTDISENTWYSLVVRDSSNRFAYSNPIWVKVRR
ncbi:MAG: CehA/McbA family metallohydrolase [Gammaproteobacteria bacterium]|nr:CehA/McbA family metallohydrolase [Gammaproteobacteria bacterium]